MSINSTTVNTLTIDTSMFTQEFHDNSMEFDSALGFELISPVLHPTDDLTWLEAIPVVPYRFEELEELRRDSQVKGPKTVNIANLINTVETMVHHLRGVADWYVQYSPAPRTLEERWQTPQYCPDFLINYQIEFFGDNSLSPWQSTYFEELRQRLIDSTDICHFCGMVKGPWCSQVVPQS